MSWLISLCDGCQHRTTHEGRCKAFPDGIPDRFLLGEDYHTEPVAGDGGLVFKAVDAAWERTAAEVIEAKNNPEPEGEGEPMP